MLRPHHARLLRHLIEHTHDHRIEHDDCDSYAYLLPDMERGELQSNSSRYHVETFYGRDRQRKIRDWERWTKIGL